MDKLRNKLNIEEKFEEFILKTLVKNIKPITNFDTTFLSDSVYELFSKKKLYFGMCGISSKCYKKVFKKTFGLPFTKFK